ncbi:MAG: hypothetical protein K2Y51_19000 [Gammaproteobacteria bacterium]|nr:hypothetical protein [Gammaproteobacteria bacterium]
MDALRTPLEEAGHARLSTAAEMRTFLRRLVASTRGSELLDLGLSAGGRPLTALRLHPRGATRRPLRVLLVGGQHGASEAAGGEALLLLARELAHGELAAARAALDLVLVPDANPDGRDLDSPRNADEVNINRDYVLVTQPEARALTALLSGFAPQVMLDAHESAAFKRKTLGREGWMTDFETQFDCGNHPAIPAKLRDYAEGELLPALIEAVRATGRPAQRYIREILSLDQALTHGGLGVHNLRNRAALGGALAVLLETRMDPRDGHYPSFRNIAVRAARQLEAQRLFLAIVAAREHELRALVAAHAHSREPLSAHGEYVAHAPPRQLRVALRGVADGALRDFEFPDHRRVRSAPPMAVPHAYWVLGHVEAVTRVLAAQGIATRRLARDEARWVSPLTVAAPPVRRMLPAGALEVPVTGLQARLLPPLFEPDSPSALWRYPVFARALGEAEEGGVLRGHRQAGA